MPPGCGMKRTLLAIVFLVLSACARGGNISLPEDPDPPPSNPPSGSETPSPRPTLINYGKAPELKNEVWLNTDQPLRLDDLRGKVVLLEMWTFG